MESTWWKQMATLSNVSKALIGFACLFGFQEAEAQVQKNSSLFNKGWQFTLSNTLSKPNANTGWEAKTLPHDWSIEGKYSKDWASCQGYLPAGIGWYKKSLKVGNLVDKEYIIRFEGVYKRSTLYINGDSVHYAANGYIPYEVNLTKYLKPNSANEIMLRVNHEDFGDCRWYTGSGIYRDVYLSVLPKSYVVRNESMLHGELLNNNSTGKYTAKIALQVAANNKLALALVQRISLNGKIIAAETQNVNKARVGMQFLTFKETIPQVKAWSTDAPTLYQVSYSLMANGKEIDKQEWEIGFKNTTYNPNTGFALNGKNMKLKGVCLHDDFSIFGAANPIELWEQKMQLLKMAGVNAIRMSHNCHTPKLYALADKMGFLVIDELFDEWEEGKRKWVTAWNGTVHTLNGYNKDFEQHAATDIAKQVKENRNYTSLLMFSIGNEVDYPNDPYSHPIMNKIKFVQAYSPDYNASQPHGDNLGRIAKFISREIKKYDTLHPVTAGLASASISEVTGYADALDIHGFNYQEFMYDTLHSSFPNRVYYGSENTHAFWAWQDVVTRPNILGQFLWTGMDYRGEAKTFPNKHWTSGLLDMNGLPKPEYYFRAMLWNKNPTSVPTQVIARKYLPSDKKIDWWAVKTGYPHWNFNSGDSVLVTVISTGTEVSATLNGKRYTFQQQSSAKGLHGKEISNATTDAKQSSVLAPAFIAVIPYEKGSLEVSVIKDGKKELYLLKENGAPTQLNVELEKKASIVPSLGYKQLNIQLLDAQGNKVNHQEGLVKLKVLSGSATVVGMENSNPFATADMQTGFKLSERETYEGKVSSYLQLNSAKAVVELSVGNFKKELTIIR